MLVFGRFAIVLSLRGARLAQIGNRLTRQMRCRDLGTLIHGRSPSPRLQPACDEAGQHGDHAEAGGLVELLPSGQWRARRPAALRRLYRVEKRQVQLHGFLHPWRPLGRSAQESADDLAQEQITEPAER